MNYTWLKVISIFLTTGVIVVGLLQFTKNTNTSKIDINLSQPGPAPPDQFQYLQVDPTSPEYYPLPQGYPPEYYRCPQLYFYYEPYTYFYRPGISVFIGCGWWHTPGVGLINIGFYHPNNRPFPNNEHMRIVKTTTNISSHNTTINISKINNVNPNNNIKPPQPPHPNQSPNSSSPHNNPPSNPHNPPTVPPHQPPHKK